MKNAIGVFAESFLYADESLKTDIEFIKEVIQINPRVMDQGLLEFLVKHDLIQYVDTLVTNGISTMYKLRGKSSGDLEKMGFAKFHALRVVRNIKPVRVK